MTLRARAIRVALLLPPLVVIAGPGYAQSVADFYRGKEMKMIIRAAPGTGYDTFSRLLAKYIVRHIPGRPTIIDINMPGGGGIKAANYVAKLAPRDGTVLTITGTALPLYQALSLGHNLLRADMRRFNWIGNMSDSDETLVTWYLSKTKTLADAKRRVTTIGGTGVGSFSVQLPALFNNLLGTKFKIVPGYRGGGAIDLAMERGEVEGRGANPWASYVATTPFVREKKLNVIIQVGLKKEHGLADVPLLLSLATNAEQKAAFDFVSKSVAVSRPVATTPGVPRERVRALRDAFNATMKDPAFLAQARKERVIIGEMSGQEVTRLIDDVVNAPKRVRDEVKTAFEIKQ